MADKLPPIDFDAQLELALAVEAAQTVADYGIEPISVIRATAYCSLHGEIGAELEVNGDPPWAGGIRCEMCTELGMKRICSISEVERLR